MPPVPPPLQSLNTITQQAGNGHECYLDSDLSAISVLTDIAEPTFLPSLFLSLQEAGFDQTIDHHEEFRLPESSIAIKV